MFQLVKGSAVIGMVFFVLVSFWPALDSEYKGPARVIDADTIEIDGKRHRLYGVDAMEIDQICRRRDGAAWPCGREAAAALAKFLEGRTVNCDIWQSEARFAEGKQKRPVDVSEQRTTRDAYGRFISICYAGSDNLSAWVANEGWAITERDANRLYNYTSQEGMAKFLGKGIWNGTFDPPAEWRRKQQAGERP